MNLYQEFLNLWQKIHHQDNDEIDKKIALIIKKYIYYKSNVLLSSKIFEESIIKDESKIKQILIDIETCLHNEEDINKILSKLEQKDLENINTFLKEYYETFQEIKKDSQRLKYYLKSFQKDFKLNVKYFFDYGISIHYALEGNDNKTVARRVRFFIEEQKINQRKLAMALRRSTGNVNKYVNGTLTIPYSILLAIETLYKINAHWLLEGDKHYFIKDKLKSLISMKEFNKLSEKGKESSIEVFKTKVKETYDKEQEELKKKEVKLNMTEARPVKMVMIPHFGDIAAGKPIDFNSDPWKWIEVADTMLKGDPKDHFALTVDGNSMVECGIVNGCDIICKRQGHYDNGNVCAVIYDNQTTLKRVRFLKNEVELIPCNQDYETTKVNSQDFRIEGKVICTFHQF